MKNERSVRNVAVSVRQRLLNLARRQQKEFTDVLTAFGLERFLYRLSASEECTSRFVLKGALLFNIWQRASNRFTRDLDLLGFGPSDNESLVALFRDLCRIDCDPDDGVEFDPATVRVQPIREEQEYGGKRIRFRGNLAGARIPMQIDIGFGDVVTPAPSRARFPPFSIIRRRNCRFIHRIQLSPKSSMLW